MKPHHLCYALIPVIGLFDGVSKAWAADIVGGTKPLVPGIVDVWVMRNRGMVFGGFEQHAIGPILAYALPLAVTGILVWFAWRTHPNRLMRHLGFACMIGGACGNLADRLMHGFVLDFIQIVAGPVVNFADLAIALGVGLVAMDLWRTPTRKAAD